VLGSVGLEKNVVLQHDETGCGFWYWEEEYVIRGSVGKNCRAIEID